MKSIYRFFTIIFCALLPAVMFTSCVDNDDDGENQILASNFVTYEGMTGGRPVFTYTNPANNNTVTLTGDLTNLTNVQTGDRCFLTYYLPSGVPADAFRDSNIKIVQLIVALKAPLQSAPALSGELPGLDLYLRSMTVNGNYLNILAQSYFAKDPVFTVIYDPATVASGTVDVYVYFTAEVSGDARALDVPASFNIGQIWSNPQVQAIKVHIRNNNHSIGTSPFLIKKQLI